MINYKNIEEIIDSYNTKIQSVIRKFVKTGNDIEDIEQEVYIKTWKNMSQYSGKSNLWCWINKITVNTCKDHLRSSKSRIFINNDTEEIIQNTPDKIPSPEKLSIFTERHKLILNAVNKLNPKLKEVVTLYDIEELTYEEISKKIKCPIGTVKSRLFNARKILKQELKDLLN